MTPLFSYVFLLMFFFFFKQKTAYEMRISDWSSDVCSSDLDQRVIIELVYGVGHSLDEVAAILQCPVGTVKARLFHARVKLRNVVPALGGGTGAQEVGKP